MEQDPVVYFVARWYTLTGRICIRDKTDYIWSRNGALRCLTMRNGVV